MLLRGTYPTACGRVNSRHIRLPIRAATRNPLHDLLGNDGGESDRRSILQIARCVAAAGAAHEQVPDKRKSRHESDSDAGSQDPAVGFWSSAGVATFHGGLRVFGRPENPATPCPHHKQGTCHQENEAGFRSFLIAEIAAGGHVIRLTSIRWPRED